MADRNGRVNGDPLYDPYSEDGRGPVGYGPPDGQGGYAPPQDYGSPNYQKPAPNPNNPPVAVNDPETWYRQVIQAQPDKYDTAIPKDVWLSWYPLWDGQTQNFKSIKTDSAGNPIAQRGDKPTDCPDGTTAYGDSQCLPLNHPKVLGVKPGGLAGALPSPAAPATPAEPRRPLTLQDMLQSMFDQKTGLFGLKEGRDPYAQQFKGQYGVDQYGEPLPNAPDLVGKALSEGGLIWGDKGLDLSGYSAPPPSAALPAAPAAAPAPTPEAYNPPAPATGVSTQPVSNPVVAPLFDPGQGPQTLQAMLRGPLAGRPRVRSSGLESIFA
jgi:hypothetical protein